MLIDWKLGMKVVAIGLLCSSRIVSCNVWRFSRLKLMFFRRFWSCKCGWLWRASDRCWYRLIRGCIFWYWALVLQFGLSTYCFYLPYTPITQTNSSISPTFPQTRSYWPFYWSSWQQSPKVPYNWTQTHYPQSSATQSFLPNTHYYLNYWSYYTTNNKITQSANSCFYNNTPHPSTDTSTLSMHQTVSKSSWAINSSSILPFI